MASRNSVVLSLALLVLAATLPCSDAAFAFGPRKFAADVTSTQFFRLSLQVCNGKIAIESLRPQWVSTCYEESAGSSSSHPEFDVKALDSIRMELEDVWPVCIKDEGDAPISNPTAGTELGREDASSPRHRRSAHGNNEKNSNKNGDHSSNNNNKNNKNKNDHTSGITEETLPRGALVDDAIPAPHAHNPALVLSVAHESHGGHATRYDGVEAVWEGAWRTYGSCSGMGLLQYFTAALDLLRTHKDTGLMEQCFTRQLAPIPCPHTRLDLSTL